MTEELEAVTYTTEGEENGATAAIATRTIHFELSVIRSE